MLVRLGSSITSLILPKFLISRIFIPPRALVVRQRSGARVAAAAVRARRTCAARTCAARTGPAGAGAAGPAAGVVWCAFARAHTRAVAVGWRPGVTRWIALLLGWCYPYVEEELLLSQDSATHTSKGLTAPRYRGCHCRDQPTTPPPARCSSWCRVAGDGRQEWSSAFEVTAVLLHRRPLRSRYERDSSCA